MPRWISSRGRRSTRRSLRVTHRMLVQCNTVNATWTCNDQHDWPRVFFFFCFQIHDVTRTFATSNEYGTATRITRNIPARIVRAFLLGDARWRGICATNAGRSRVSNVPIARTVSNGRPTYANTSREFTRIAASMFWTFGEPISSLSLSLFFFHSLQFLPISINRTILYLRGNWSILFNKRNAMTNQRMLRSFCAYSKYSKLAPTMNNKTSKQPSRRHEKTPSVRLFQVPSEIGGHAGKLADRRSADRRKCGIRYSFVQVRIATSRLIGRGTWTDTWDTSVVSSRALSARTANIVAKWKATWASTYWENITIWPFTWLICSPLRPRVRRDRRQVRHTIFFICPNCNESFDWKGEYWRYRHLRYASVVFSQPRFKCCSTLQILLQR